jgi:hypothetical protein
MGKAVLLFAAGGLAAAGCTPRAPDADVDPVTLAQATAFAEKLGAIPASCPRDQMEALVDDEALAAKIVTSGHLPGGSLAVRELAGKHLGASVLCAWRTDADSYHLLRVRTVGTRFRPLMRRISKNPRTHLAGVGYDELELGVSRADHQVRVIDVLPYSDGRWLSESIGTASADVIRSGGQGDLDAVRERADDLRRIAALVRERKGAEALAALDHLPADLGATRNVRLMRVAAARAVSDQAYQKELEAIAAAYPRDPSIAMLEIDGAFLRKDYDAALANIDIVDAAIGGDSWQDAIRALALLHRGRPGDLDRAAARAEAATRAEPSLAKGWWSRLEVELARKRWPEALAVMDELMRRFQAAFTEESMRRAGVYDELFATPEYAAWRARHS